MEIGGGGQSTQGSSHRVDGTVGVSRRRITFRPYSLANAAAPLPQQPTTSTADAEHSGSAAATATGKTTRKWGSWSNSEIFVFYDGIKQYGKDFDQVARLMSRRKMNKDKEQIRNYYFNSFKTLRASISEEQMADIPRDARELFIVINFFEWKKKTGDAKVDVIKLRQLIFEGSTSVRLKKKKQLVVVRTPFCPALQKLFPSRKQEEPLPTHVIVTLTPKQEADRGYVERCAQNPLVRIRISVGDHLKRIFTLLKMKWVPRLRKYASRSFDENRDKDGIANDECMKLVLYPHKETPVGRVQLRYVEEYAPTAFSLNRLKKERSRLAPEEGEEHSNQSDTTALASQPSESAATADCHAVEVPSSLYSGESSAFILNETTLRSGLTELNVGDATTTELFYLCGMRNEIHLEYSTNAVRDQSLEPWRIFVSLITRNYGENLCKILAESGSAEEAKQVMVTVEDRNRKRRSSNAEGTTGGPPSLKVAKPVAQEVPSSSPTAAAAATVTSAPAVTSALAVGGERVVQSENDAFMQQLESLETKKRSKSLFRRSPAKRPAPSYELLRGLGSTSLATSSGGCCGDVALAISARKLVASGGAVQSSSEALGCRFGGTTSGAMMTPPSGGASVQPAVDFSAISFERTVEGGAGDSLRTPERILEVYPHAHLALAATPNTQFAAEVLTSMVGRDRLRGNAGRCSSGSPSMQIDAPRTERRGGGGAKGAGRQGSSPDGAEKTTLHELSAMEMAAGAGGAGASGAASLDMSPMKSMSSLPEDVRHSFEMMMQQNSVDYCRNFEQLLSTIDTPKKQ